MMDDLNLRVFIKIQIKKSVDVWSDLNLWFPISSDWISKEMK